MISFTRPSVQTELDRFYKSLSKSSVNFESVSKSAFTQSRKKLKPEAFIELSNNQLEYFKEHAPSQKTWKDKRIVAIDGSLLNLPHTDDVEKEFGGVSNQHEKTISARCSFAYDVCNELVLDSKIASRNSCEKDLAVDHLKSLNPSTDILVFDRGYPSQWMFGLLKKKGFSFCFRLSTAWKDACQKMENQQDIDWSMIRRSKKDLGKLKTYDLPTKTDGLRLVAIELSTGEKEVLVTNLDHKTHTREDLKKLYHMRWGIEESYKSFKKTLHIEHFTGRTSLSVKQDFYARVFMLNMSSMIRSQGVDHHQKKQVDSKHVKKANKTQVLAKTKDFLTDLFYHNNLRKVIKQMLKLLNKRLEIVRPNRSFSRKKSASHRKSKIMNSKGI